MARGIGVAHTIGVLLLVVVASRRAHAEASLLVTAVASQIVAPVMWDHYIVVLFLPIAWLLARHVWWVLAIGVALNAMFVLLVPPILYVVAMDIVMLAVTWIGRERAARELAGLRPAATAA